MSLSPPIKDVLRRQPVWAAWSGIYLDRARAPESLTSDERYLAASDDTLDELRQILFEEVHPACLMNLMIPFGGEWESFSDEWLRERILGRASATLRLPARLMPDRAAVRRVAQPILTRVAAMRLGGTCAGDR